MTTEILEPEVEVMEFDSPMPLVSLRLPYFKLVFKKERLFSHCVYRILFGDKFYLGSTGDFNTRMAAHESAIKRYLEGRYDKQTASCYSIVDHMKNSGICVAKAEVLEYINNWDRNGAYEAEQKWFDYYDHSLLLNRRKSK